MAGRSEDRANGGSLRSVVNRTARAYYDIVYAVCSVLSFGSPCFSRTVWIVSCVLTSVGLVTLAALMFVAAPLVHDAIDRLAVLTFAVSVTVSGIMALLDFLCAVLESLLLYWLVLAVGIVVHVTMSVGAVVVAVGAIAFGVFGIFLAFKYDPTTDINPARSDSDELLECYADDD